MKTKEKIEVLTNEIESLKAENRNITWRLEKIETIEFPQQNGFFSAPSIRIKMHECIKMIMKHLNIKLKKEPSSIKIIKIVEE